MRSPLTGLKVKILELTLGKSSAEGQIALSLLEGGVDGLQSDTSA